MSKQNDKRKARTDDLYQWERFSRYGLTKVEFDNMVLKQKGRCLICNRVPEWRSLHVDHDHTTGKVRGLLCRDCNLGLGNFHDNIVLLQIAIRYLEQFGCQ